MVQSKLNPSNSGGPVIQQPYNRDRDRKKFAKMIVVYDFLFNFEEYLDFITYILDTYNLSFEGFSRSTVKKDILNFKQNIYSFFMVIFYLMDNMVSITTDMDRNPNRFYYLNCYRTLG